MGWIHRHKRYGAGLALAALALQIVLSFGHVHLDRAAQASVAVAATTHGKAVVQAPQQIPAQNPADDDYCAICASIYLASSSLVALPPQLPVPAEGGRLEHSYNAAFGVIAPRRFAFQSRAPPAA